MNPDFRDSEQETTLSVKVIPRAKRNEVSGFLEDGTVKIRVTAPPIKGQANHALVEFLADTLGIPSSNLALVSGEKARLKRILITGLDKESVFRILQNTSR